MVTEEDVFSLIESNQNSPEVAEAAYLASKCLKIEQINRNLRLRYGSGQGFAQFKDEIIESTEYDSLTGEYNSHGAQIELQMNERSTRLDRITVQDVDIPLDTVIQEAFSKKVGGQLREQVRENLPTLTQDAKCLACIGIRGYDFGLWDNRTEPDTDTLWNLYSILTGETPTEAMKTDIVEELVREGFVYVDNSDLILTPAFTQVEDPYEYLPRLHVEHRD